MAMDEDKDMKDNEDDGGQHCEEDFTGDGRPDPVRPVPPPPDPNKHDR
jgi:hypothetical protein